MHYLLGKVHFAGVRSYVCLSLQLAVCFQLPESACCFFGQQSQLVLLFNNSTDVSKTVEGVSIIRLHKSLMYHWTGLPQVPHCKVLAFDRQSGPTARMLCVLHRQKT